MPLPGFLSSAFVAGCQLLHRRRTNVLTEVVVKLDRLYFLRRRWQGVAAAGSFD